MRLQGLHVSHMFSLVSWSLACVAIAQVRRRHKVVR